MKSFCVVVEMPSYSFSLTPFSIKLSFLFYIVFLFNTFFYCTTKGTLPFELMKKQRCFQLLHSSQCLIHLLSLPFFWRTLSIVVAKYQLNFSVSYRPLFALFLNSFNYIVCINKPYTNLKDLHVYFFIMTCCSSCLSTVTLR